MTNAGLPEIAALFDSTVPAPYDDDHGHDDNVPRRRNGNGHRLNGNGHRNGDGRRHGPSDHSTNRFAVLNAFVDISMRTVSKSDRGVWLVLYRETKPDGLARISEKQIAALVAADERTVRRSINRLQKAGLIEIARRGGIGRGPSWYRIFGSPRK